MGVSRICTQKQMPSGKAQHNVATNNSARQICHPAYAWRTNNPNSRPILTIVKSKRQSFPNNNARQNPNNVSGTLRYLLKKDQTVRREIRGYLESKQGGRGAKSYTRLENIPNHHIALEARIAELEKFHADSHNAIAAHGTMLQANVEKTEEFIVLTERNEEVDSHAMKINA